MPSKIIAKSPSNTPEICFFESRSLKIKIPKTVTIKTIAPLNMGKKITDGKAPDKYKLSRLYPRLIAPAKTEKSRVFFCENTDSFFKKDSVSINKTMVKADISIILLPLPSVLLNNLKTMPVAEAKKKNPIQKNFHLGAAFISDLASRHNKTDMIIPKTPKICQRLTLSLKYKIPKIVENSIEQLPMTVVMETGPAPIARILKYKNSACIMPYATPKKTSVNCMLTAPPKISIKTHESEDTAENINGLRMSPSL